MDTTAKTQSREAAKETEITPAMIDAGVAALRANEGYDRYIKGDPATVVDIFRAMFAASADAAKAEVVQKELNELEHELKMQAIDRDFEF